MPIARLKRLQRRKYAHSWIKKVGGRMCQQEALEEMLAAGLKRFWGGNVPATRLRRLQERKCARS